MCVGATAARALKSVLQGILLSSEGYYYLPCCFLPVLREPCFFCSKYILIHADNLGPSVYITTYCIYYFHYAAKRLLGFWLLQFFREKLNSMNLLLYMAPVAVIFLLPATLLMEHNVVGITVALARNDVKIIWYLLFNSALAYCVNLTNFLVTKHTSALTLQVFPNQLLLACRFVLAVPMQCVLWLFSTHDVSTYYPM